MTSNDYIRGPSGTRYSYAEIADRIRKEAPHTLGKHISVQLEAIGLLDETRNGTTPCGLPFSFAMPPRWQTPSGNARPPRSCWRHWQPSCPMPERACLAPRVLGT